MFQSGSREERELIEKIQNAAGYKRTSDILPNKNLLDFNNLSREEKQKIKKKKKKIDLLLFSREAERQRGRESESCVAKTTATHLKKMEGLGAAMLEAVPPHNFFFF